MVAWCTLFIQVVGKDAPECALPDDLDERETNHWWKAKKWAYSNLNRLFARYGNPQSMSKSDQEALGAVAKAFSEQ